MDDSAYLKLTRRRFESDRGVIPGDRVPWELDDKETGLRWVNSQGYATAEFIRAGSPREAIESGLARWGRLVLKQPNSHSTHGVYFVEQLESGALFDHLRFRLIDPDNMPVVGNAPDYWLAEQWIDSGIPGVAAPPDYKLYCFRGQISHLWQVDRCVSPPRIAIFDGAFLPLVMGRDFELPSSRVQHGWHRIPVHARAMLQMAQRLSLAMDTRHVRIDCFDGPTGPVVGELTFASGVDNARGCIPSPSLAAIIDSALDERPIDAASGFDIDLSRFWSLPAPLADIVGARDELRIIQTGALSGDRRYPRAARRRLQRTPGSEVLELSLRVISVLNGDHRTAFGLQESLTTPTGTITGPARRAEFQAIARDFHNERSHNSWHASRAAEMTKALA